MRVPPTAPPPARASRERKAILLDAFRRDLTFWIGSEPRVALRVMRLIDDVLREPYSGIGKPEPLKYGSGWSRRIAEEHRMVYELTSAGPEFLTARYHYHR
ncbi:Txe/YoeB family addiction module toxin [Longimicrobium sp.]|jgi:toxin YoeB|uniref:Txe/YoeB family addiction module toxin n=1 Tax=Longimicrobium sp. TaxID=2029185 RepID=UPI002F95CA79